MTSSSKLTTSRISRIDFVLYAAFVLQAIGLILFATQQLPKILPEGNSDILDWIYRNGPVFQATKYIAVIIFAVGLLFSRTLRFRILSACVALISVHYNQPWALLILYPLQCIRTKSSESEKDKNTPQPAIPKTPVSLILLATVLGGFVLMTAQLPFPHNVTATQTIYIHSLSTVFLGTVALCSLFPVALSIRLIDRLKLDDNIKAGLLACLLLLALFLAFSVYASNVFASFINQFHLSGVPFMVAGLCSNFVLILLGAIDVPFHRNLDLSFMHRKLTGRFFWIKFLGLFIVVRQFCLFLLHMDQNFLAVFLFDIFNALLPVITFWLLFSLVNRTIKPDKHLNRWRVISLLLLIVSLIPSLLQVRKDWTLKLELNRPTAAFYSQNSRKILAFLGVNTSRESSQLLVQFQNGIRKSIGEDRLTVNDVFGRIKTPKQPNHNLRPDHPPHIFVIVSDATYSGHLSTYGYHRQTSPNLSQFAKDAVLFRQFYSSSSATAQGVASLFTGYYHGNYPHLRNQRRGTLCRSLRKKNYRLILSSLVDTIPSSAMRKDCRHSLKISYNKIGAKDWDGITSSIKEQPNTPVFVYVHLSGGHDPWKLPDGKKRFGSGKIDIYDALLYEADAQFGRFIESIKKLGIYENSIVIFTADHGIGLGRHLDQVSYSNLYDVNMKVPLVIRVPGIRPSIVNTASSLVDIRPTIEDLINIQSEDPFHGRSLADVLVKDDPGENRCVFATATYSDHYAMQCSNGWKLYYSRNLNFLEFFNSASDPYEVHPLLHSLSPAKFSRISRPLIGFLAYGAETYARTP